MPFLSHLMPVGLQEAAARPYFLQLTSAIAYLHDHGISRSANRLRSDEQMTKSAPRPDLAHNDIKPANILLSHQDTPVIVDFGFAQRWDLSNTDGRGPTEVSGLAVSSNKAGSTHIPFWSEISWGTPEYLDPLVCPHDIPSQNDAYLAHNSACYRQMARRETF
jgi:protein-serine/threonine kinase